MIIRSLNCFGGTGLTDLRPPLGERVRISNIVRAILEGKNLLKKREGMKVIQTAMLFFQVKT